MKLAVRQRGMREFGGLLSRRVESRSVEYDAGIVLPGEDACSHFLPSEKSQRSIYTGQTSTNVGSDYCHVLIKVETQECMDVFEY
jgi:hypothetical protein